jgi:hypothetical protein
VSDITGATGMRYLRQRERLLDYAASHRFERISRSNLS